MDRRRAGLYWWAGQNKTGSLHCKRASMPHKVRLPVAQDVRDGSQPARAADQSGPHAVPGQMLPAAARSGTRVADFQRATVWRQQRTKAPSRTRATASDCRRSQCTARRTRRSHGQGRGAGVGGREQCARRAQAGGSSSAVRRRQPSECRVSDDRRRQSYTINVPPLVSAGWDTTVTSRGERKAIKLQEGHMPYDEVVQLPPVCQVISGFGISNKGPQSA